MPDIKVILQTIADRHAVKAEKVGLKTFACSLKAASKGRNFTATITSDRMDRDDEVLIPSGMIPSEFMKGKRTIFWNHDYGMPIGAAKTLKQFDNRWESEAFLAENTQKIADFFPDYVWSLMEQDILGGVSVGFVPVETRRPTQKDYERYGDRLRNVVSKWKLLEWSIAPLQANIDGVVTAVQKGLIKPDYAKRVFPNLVIPEPQKLVAKVFIQKEMSMSEMIARGLRKADGMLYEN